MAVTLSYNINSLQSYTTYDQYTDVVIRVDWSCVGTGIGQVGPQSGSTVSYSYPNMTQLTLNTGSWIHNNFIPYSQLTKQIVMDWVFVEIGNQKDAIDNYVTTQTQQLVNPTIVNLPLPWSQPTFSNSQQT